MKLGQFKTIGEPDQPAQWLHWNTRVKGYVGEVDLPTDQYILRPIEHIFQDACNMVRHLPDGRSNIADGTKFSADLYGAPVVLPEFTDKNCAHIVDVKEIDDYGSLQFKWRYWGVPER
jgi:hypothetical protein